MEPAAKVYDTVSEAVNDLAKRGYTVDLSLCAERNVLRNEDQAVELSPEKFRIDEIHRFEGITDPGDEMIVFAISSLDNKIKGTVVNGFGAYASPGSSALVDHLQTHLSKK